MTPFRCTLAAAAVLLAAPGVLAGIPDWAKPIAESAPPVPEGSPEWPSRLLFTETRIEVDPKGATWRVVERSAAQILSNRADDVMYGFFGFNDDTKVKKSKGWHVPPGERAERNLGGSVDITMGDTFLTDAKARGIALEGIKRGSLVFMEFEAERRPYTSTESFPLGNPARPVDRERIVVTAPAGWTLRHAWLRAPGPEPAKDASGWVFERTGWVPPKEEPLGPDAADLTPRLVIALDPPGGAAAVPSLPDWDAFAKWFQGLAQGKDAPDPSIERAAREALATAGPEPLDRVRALALLVRNRVRYLSRAIGIGGYTPAPARETLAGLYGDCKDKGTLFRAVLHSAGFTSYPILINATEAETVADGIPDPGSFDHFVVGVLWPKDAAVPDEVSSAIVDVPGLGKVLVVDTTDEYAWPGTLPATLAGRRGALVAGDKGILVTMPPGDPATHRIERSTVVTFAADGGAAVTTEVKYFGWPAERARAAYAESAVRRREGVEHDARQAWSGAQVRDYKSTLEAGDGAYVESVTLDLPAGAADLQDGLVGIFTGVGGDLARVPLGKRKGPIVYDTPVRISYQASIVGAPEGGLPPPHEAAGDGWRVKSGIAREGGAVKGSLVYERTRTRFDPDAFPEVKQMWSAVSKAGSAAISLRPLP